MSVGKSSISRMAKASSQPAEGIRTLAPEVPAGDAATPPKKTTTAAKKNTASSSAITGVLNSSVNCLFVFFFAAVFFGVFLLCTIRSPP